MSHSPQWEDDTQELGKEEPWWNDGDKVGGMFATILMLTVTICVCLLLIGLVVQVAF
jgi:hypothetical protein